MVSVNTYSYADRARGDKMRKNEGVATMAAAVEAAVSKSLREKFEEKQVTAYGEEGTGCGYSLYCLLWLFF